MHVIMACDSYMSKGKTRGSSCELNGVQIKSPQRPPNLSNSPIYKTVYPFLATCPETLPPVPQSPCGASTFPVAISPPP